MRTLSAKPSRCRSSDSLLVAPYDIALSRRDRASRTEPSAARAIIDMDTSSIFMPSHCVTCERCDSKTVDGMRRRSKR